jgi:hypothetical protein
MLSCLSGTRRWKVQDDTDAQRIEELQTKLESTKQVQILSPVILSQFYRTLFIQQALEQAESRIHALQDQLQQQKCQ